MLWQSWCSTHLSCACVAGPSQHCSSRIQLQHTQHKTCDAKTCDTKACDTKTCDTPAMGDTNMAVIEEPGEDGDLEEGESRG